jgi:hypothetical protein
MEAVMKRRFEREFERWTRADWLVAAGAGLTAAAGARAGYIAEANLRTELGETSMLKEVAVELSRFEAMSLIILALAATLMLVGILSRPVRFEARSLGLSLGLTIVAGLAAVFSLLVLGLSLYLAVDGEITTLAIRREEFEVGDRIRLALTQIFVFGPLTAVLAAVAIAAGFLTAARRAAA